MNNFEILLKTKNIKDLENYNIQLDKYNQNTEFINTYFLIDDLYFDTFVYFFTDILMMDLNL